MNIVERLEKLKSELTETDCYVDNIKNKLNSKSLYNQSDVQHLKELEGVFGYIQEALINILARVEKLESYHGCSCVSQEENTEAEEKKECNYIAPCDNNLCHYDNRQDIVPFIVERSTSKKELTYLTLGATRNPSVINSIPAINGEALICLKVGAYVKHIDINGMVGKVRVYIITSKEEVIDYLTNNNGMDNVLDVYTDVKKIILKSNDSFLIDSLTLYK